MCTVKQSVQCVCLQLDCIFTVKPGQTSLRQAGQRVPFGRHDAKIYISMELHRFTEISSCCTKDSVASCNTVLQAAFISTVCEDVLLTLCQSHLRVLCAKPAEAIRHAPPKDRELISTTQGSYDELPKSVTRRPLRNEPPSDCGRPGWESNPSTRDLWAGVLPLKRYG